MTIYTTRFRAWLKRRPTGAALVQLAQDTPIGMQAIAQWNADEVEKGQEPDAGESEIVALMLMEAQEVCDATGEPMSSFSDGWGRMVRSRSIRTKRP